MKDDIDEIYRKRIERIEKLKADKMKFLDDKKSSLDDMIFACNVFIWTAVSAIILGPFLIIILFIFSKK